MKIKYLTIILILIIFFSWVVSCDSDNNENINIDGEEQAIIKFFNESSFTVDIYKNFNPEYYDPSTLLCTINPNSPPKEVKVYSSFDKYSGDTFYIRFKLQLANSYETGTVDIFTDAQRDLSHLSFVVESGQIYNKTIPQPILSELRLVKGYIAVFNKRPTQVQIQNGITRLYKIDNNSAYVETGQTGYFEIPFSILGNTNITQMRAMDSSYMDFPEFTIERDKLYVYWFEIESNGTITGPIIKPIISF